MSLLAVDLGSSTCKAVAFSLAGETLSQHSSSYAPHFARPGFAEMNPHEFWDAVCVCCRRASEGSTDPVRALCLSSHGETFVPLDLRGQPVMAAILNQDARAIEESIWCEASIGREVLFQITGLFAHPMYPVPKILWLKRHQPEIFGASHTFVTLIGYLLTRMGLPPYVDYTLASRFLAFDIRKRVWSEEILDQVGLDKSRLPEPVPTGTVVGTLNSETASALGLRQGTPVVLGGHDQPCAALGAGVIEQGRVADSIGTYECLIAASDEPSLSKEALAASLNSYCHVVAGKFVTLAYFPSGIMVKWFHDLIYTDGAATDMPSAGDDREAFHYADLEAKAPQSPTGLCITPHLIGTCNPEFNPHVGALISGLTPGTGRPHIYKGILEGLACELSVVGAALADAVGPFEDIYVTGGGTRSVLGMQLRAAITGWRLHVMRQQEAVCFGGAILAGVATGEYASIRQAVNELVRESAVLTPDARVTAAYEDQKRRYREMRSAVVRQAGRTDQGRRLQELVRPEFCEEER